MIGSSDHVIAILLRLPWAGGDLVVSGELEGRHSALLGFVARIAGFRADSPNRAGCKPRGHGKTLWITHATIGPASSAYLGPARARWAGGAPPKESRPFDNY